MILARYRGGLIVVAALSAAVNLLMLTGPLFMLQIYDRVLTSRSEATLVALLAECARIAVLDGGRMQLFGPTERVLPRIPGFRRPQLVAVPRDGERKALADGTAREAPPASRSRGEVPDDD
ncbi:MAG: hypothetical protein F4213_02410 [Boseongicola sp. SB0677_bin_26]|nr:hypothetical protein [Boseongicola sp. SB0665_bin_10]MYG24870.1 hypothetical protein [Boseongicola sp. SB0677_bin_26]